MHKYCWKDDNIGPDLIAKDICMSHSTPELDNFVQSLIDAFKQHESIFPLYMRNFCHESMAHTFQLVMGGFREDIQSYIIQLQNNGFVHSTDLNTPKTYSFMNDNNRLCMFMRTGDRIKHQVIFIKIHLNQIENCKSLLTDMVKNLES